MTFVSNSFEIVRTYVGSATWGPLVRLSRGIVLGLLRRVEIGQLVVTDFNGAVFACGQAPAKDNWPKTELKVFKETFWVRVLLFADMVRANCWESNNPDLGDNS